MATNYPTGPDDLPDIISNDTMDGEVGGVDHDALHNDTSDAVNALQDTVGYTGDFNFLPTPPGTASVGAAITVAVTSPLQFGYTNTNSFNFSPIPSGTASVGNAIVVTQASPLALGYETIGTFTAAGQLFVGTGNGTGEVLNSGSVNSVLMVGGSDASGLEWQSLGIETVNVVAVSGSSQTLGFVGNDVTLSASCAFAMPTAMRGGWCYSIIRQAVSLGPFTATFTGVKWPSSTPPVMSTGASAVDRYDFVSDGTHWYGIITGQAFG